MRVTELTPEVWEKKTCQRKTEKEKQKLRAQRERQKEQ